MKQFLLFVAPFLLGIILFIGVLRVVGTEGIVLGLSLFLSLQGMALLFLTFLIVLVGTLRWKRILKGLGFKIPFLKLFQVYIVGFAIDYFLPMTVFGSEAVKAHILKENHSVPWQKGLASSLTDRILELTAVLLLIFPGIILFLLEVSLPPKSIGILLFGALFVIGGSITFFYFKNSRRESILKFFRINHNGALEAEQEISYLFRSKKIFQPLYFSFLKATLLFLRVWLLMFFMGETLGISLAWPTFSFAWLGTRIPVPADIGSHDIIQIFAFSALELGATKGTALAMTTRAMETLISLLGLIFLVKFGSQFLEKILTDKTFKNNEELENSSPNNPS